MTDTRTFIGEVAYIAALEEGEAADVESSLEELSLLLLNLGIRTVGRCVQKRERPDPGSYIGSGKAEEVADEAKELGATIIVIDGRISPGQAANLGRITGLSVWDRPLVIMKIFEERAQTGEAKLQIELARCKYEVPFLKGLGLQMSRPGAGLGTRGPGETEFERHRRKLERRIRGIKKEIETIRDRRTGQRKQRVKAGLTTIALAGYTNSGKSTLLRRLSGDKNLIVADKLFSTLDPFVRRVRLPGGSFTLMVDTVGFIRNLPPGLVTAFRATLEEVAASDLILLVADASSRRFMEDISVVEDTLSSIGAEKIPKFIVMNKIDSLDAGETEARVAAAGRSEDPVIPVSAARGDNMQLLLDAIDRFFELRPGKERDRSC
ncbi:MAG: GTPase HflX [Thermovirgaceae bacterium]|nr:GTPase HflX [Thermovirgaceae bacterium]